MGQRERSNWGQRFPIWNPNLDGLSCKPLNGVHFGLAVELQVHLCNCDCRGCGMPSIDLKNLFEVARSALPGRDLGYLKDVRVTTNNLQNLLTEVSVELTQEAAGTDKHELLCSARGLLLELLWHKAVAAA